MKGGQLKNKGPINKIPLKKNTLTEIEEKGKSYYDLVGLAIIILLGIIIYSNSFACSFHLDDLNNIVENLKIRNLSDVKAWWNFAPNRPVAIFTFALNYHFNQLDVHYWHLVNLVIHFINAVLVWWLTLLIFSSPALKGLQMVRNKRILAFVTALLFVSHPLATQSVTYIVQRMTSLVAMFYLLSLVLYVKGRLTDKGVISRVLLFSGSFLSASLAMFTKENAFTLPVAILLFEFFFIRTKKFSINFKDYRIIISIILFLGAMSIIPLKYSYSIFKPISAAGHPEVILNPYNYLLTQFSVIVKYLQLLLLPINQNLDYSYPISNSFFEIRTVLSFLFLTSLMILAIFLFRKYRIISFGIFWFFLTLSIESSIIPINDVIFEHRTYLPSFGFFIILSIVIGGLFMNNYKALAICTWAIIVLSYSISTYERNKIWKDDLTLWNEIVKKSPNKARSFVNRGFAYSQIGQYDKALADYTKATEIDPMYEISWGNRGYIYFQHGQWGKAINDFSKAIEINPKYAEAYSNRSAAYGKIGQYDKAITDITKVMELTPDYYIAYSNRGAIYATLKQPEKAIADYSRAIELNPEFAEAFCNRGYSYGELGQWNKAFADFSTAIGIDPDFKDTYVNRAGTYFNLKQWDKAIADYTHAIDLDPNLATGYYNRGLAYWSLGQMELAIADYSATIRISSRFIQAYVNRGNAYGKLGQWNKALDDFNRALSIDPNFALARSNREIAIRNLKKSNNH